MSALHRMCISTFPMTSSCTVLAESSSHFQTSSALRRCRWAANQVLVDHLIAQVEKLNKADERLAKKRDEHEELVGSLDRETLQAYREALVNV
jgi:hypothetical protein